MIPVGTYKGRRVGVLGLGRSGLAVARALVAGGADVVAWDDSAERRASAEAEGLATADPARPQVADTLAGLIVSPGISHLYPAPHPSVAAAWARDVVVDNEIGLFFAALAEDGFEEHEHEPKVVCVTGSNGKSTTAALIHHCLVHAGRPAQLGGNIGRAALSLDVPGDGEVMVLELSSYQIELARRLEPDVAVFTNLSPDHLDRHGGHGGYFAAKARLFLAGAPGRAVIGVDETEGQALAGQMTAGGDARVVRVSSRSRVAGQGHAVFARRGFLAEWRAGRQLASVDLRQITALPGAHNHQNICAAWAALRALGLAPREIEAGLRSFGGLPHRCQVLGTRDGVVWVNDSKATNADAAAHALAAFKHIRWIVGGVPKAGGIESLRPLFGRLAGAYLIGQAAPEFAMTLGTDVPHRICGTLEAAVAAARSEAAPGDVVLLAPACASFDQFADFEERGAQFARLAGF